MARQWYIWLDDQRLGPVPSASLRRCAAEGKIGPGTLICPVGEQEWVPASSVQGLFTYSAAPLPPVASPSLPYSPPSESNVSDTGTCAFCRKPMPSDALQCSSCQNWRREIHVLIDTYRKLALGQLAVHAIGVPLAVIVFIMGARQPSARITTLWDSEFSFEKFVTTPAFAIGVLIVVLVWGVWAVLQVPAAKVRRRIQKTTKGLWKRPWWTF
ncbi:MAG: GYF domain-containing protein [Thermoguttaceae bacterium]